MRIEFITLLVLLAAGFTGLFWFLRRQVRIDGGAMSIDAVLRSEFNRIERAVREGFLDNRKEMSENARQNRDELSNQILNLTQANERKLEQIRTTVDEKLHATLEKRLGDSFKFVSERLELVHKGLGEMQSLASGVGDLKRVLTNVKARGIFGEVQLAALLEQIFTQEQYGTNISTKRHSADRVEFAIKLPGRGEGAGIVWLPIDAKFPQEDYQRLLDAYEQASVELAETAAKQMEARIKSEARSIKEKYLDPPYTTDFGILFLPYESLFAEVVRRPGLADFIRRECQVVIMGPNNLYAFLNSLQMGFRTLAIEKRSSEVWLLLGAVKTEFERFGDILEKTQKKLQEASNTIEDAARKSRTIQRKLKSVQTISEPDTAGLLAVTEPE